MLKFFFILLVSINLFAVDLFDKKDFFKSCRPGPGFSMDNVKGFSIVKKGDNLVTYNGCPADGIIKKNGKLTIMNLAINEKKTCFYAGLSVSVSCTLY